MNKKSRKKDDEIIKMTNKTEELVKNFVGLANTRKKCHSLNKKYKKYFRSVNKKC